MRLLRSASKAFGWFLRANSSPWPKVLRMIVSRYLLRGKSDKCNENKESTRSKGGTMGLVYIVTKGVDDPTLASVPLHIAANGSLEIGQEVSVVLAGDGTDLVLGENAQSIEGVGVPPMRELLGKLKDHQVPVYV